MTSRPKGRPGGNPSRDQSGESRLSVAEIVRTAMAAEALMPSLSEQFSALDVGVQSRMFRVLDVVAGMEHEQKIETQVLLTGLRRLEGVSTELADLLGAMESLVFFYDRLTTPEQGESRAQSLAERYLAEYAEREG